MAHWLDGVAKILKSPELDIIKLAQLAGVDPTYVYQYADLSQCDLRGQDLRKIDLTGAVIEGALLDSATRLDRKVDPRINSKGYFFFKVNARLVRYVNSEAHHAGYTYAVWFAKYIFEMSYNIKDLAQFKEFMDELYELNVEEFFSINNARSLRRSVQMPNYIKNWVQEFNYKELNDESYSFLILSCILFRLRYHSSSIANAIENLVERENEFRKNSVYLSGF